MKRDELLLKYFDGQTTQEEEALLKKKILDEPSDSAEKDMFAFFNQEGKVPENLEEIFAFLPENEVSEKKKTQKMRFWQLSSAAAVLIVFLGSYFVFQQNKKARMENDFFVMEQALFRISESIQPEEEEEILVLWVDSDVEIIIND